MTPESGQLVAPRGAAERRVDDVRPVPPRESERCVSPTTLGLFEKLNDEARGRLTGDRQTPMVPQVAKAVIPPNLSLAQQLDLLSEQAAAATERKAQARRLGGVELSLGRSAPSIAGRLGIWR